MTDQTDGNGGRATIRDVLQAVEGLNERIDGVNERVDAVIDRQDDQYTKLSRKIDGLRRVTNERLHEVDAEVTSLSGTVDSVQSDVVLLKRPWEIMQQGWRRTVAIAGGASVITGLVVRFFEVPWPF